MSRNAEGIAAALEGERRMEFYRELLAAAPEDAEGILRRWWCEAMLDTDPSGDRVIEAALNGTLPRRASRRPSRAARGPGCPLSESHGQDTSCGRCHSEIQVASRSVFTGATRGNSVCVQTHCGRAVVAEDRCPRGQSVEVPGGHPGEVVEALLVNTASRCASLCAPDVDHFASPTG